ncbi:toll/interleukin-1 receptor domain-containing protein [Bacillus marinisedimentorum]|uniref:toll/interleukin-1 receptor domain-containing protein n=1 Tax=Bacillus marinisedimentorum TaxID=1821260 RepID=UPI000872DC1B|nr:toll/interleukin-1 receptor domain-containing protein [Bacillus marinisedimentorum]
MKEIPRPFKTFIPYSWIKAEHEDWVYELASRLREDGVDVVLDKWDLKDEMDLYEFIVKTVKDPEVERVLIICDEGYYTKVQKSSGGVELKLRLFRPKYLMMVYRKNSFR